MSTYFRRKKIEHFGTEGLGEVDYKNIHLLKNYVTETGKIVPSRITGASAKLQRQIAKAIKQARFLSLMPYCDHHR